MSDKLSIENMMEMAMGLSMTSLYTQAMSNSMTQLNSSLQSSTQAPPRYIYAILEGTQQGPFSLGEIMQLIKEGRIDLETYIWKAGMQGWQKASEVDDLSSEFAQLPPELPNVTEK